MTTLLRVLRVVILLELVGVTGFALWRVRRPQPPLANLQRLDAVTADELRQLRQNVRRQDTAQAWQTLGDGYVSFGYFSEAEVCYRHAAHQERDSSDLMLRWGICLDRLGRTSQAIEQYQRAAELTHGRQQAVCQYHIARCRLRDEDLARSEQALRDAGDFPLARYQLAKLLVRSARTAEAMPILVALLRAYPDALKLNLLRSQAESALEHPAEAIQYRERVERSKDRLFLDSTVEFLGLLRTNFGLLRQKNRCIELERSGRLEEAARCLREIHAAEWDATTLRELIRLELQLGHAETALQLLDELNDRVGRSPESWEQRGDALLLKGQAEEARRAWERAVDLRPNARLHRKLADYFDQHEGSQRARQHRAGAEYELGLSAFRSDELKDAMSHFNEAVTLAPDHAQPWFYLAECQRFVGNVEESEKAYHHCLELQPEHGRARMGLTRLHSRETRR